MTTGIRTLGVVGGVEDRQTSVDTAVETAIEATVEAAAREASNAFSAESDLKPAMLRERLASVVATAGVADRIEQAKREDRSCEGAALLAEALPHRAGSEPSGEVELTDDGWQWVATTFLEALRRELVAIDPETGETPLHRAAAAALDDGAFETAVERLELSLDLAGDIGDVDAELTSLVRLAEAMLSRGELAAAEKHYRQGLRRARQVDDRSVEATCLGGLGNVALQREALEAAEESLRESLDIAREIDDPSTEANSLASLGTVAAERAEFETAEMYLRESRDLKRLLDDDAGEATTLASLGTVAEDRGEYSTAIDRYESALDGFVTADKHRERLQILRGLVELEAERGHDDAALARCDETLAWLAEADLTGTTRDRRWFETTRARLTGDTAAIESLYATALEHVRAGEDPDAFELLGGLWNCREAVDDTEAYGLTLRAGVGYASYHLLLETDTVETTCESVVTAIEPHSELLSEPAAELLRFADSGGAERDAEIDSDDTDPDESIDALERVAYAEFLGRISETPTASELYATALRGIGGGNTDVSSTVQHCLVAWDQRTTEEYSRATLGAGLLVEAHREVFDIRLPIDRESVLVDVDDHRETLSEPLTVLFEWLDTGSTETTPATLRERVDSDDLSVTDIERLVVAGFVGEG